MKTIVKHAYIRTRTGGLIFYSVKDCLVYFTLFCTIARKYSVRVLGLCLMYDHIHIMVEIQSQSQLTRLVQECSSRYARAFNMSSGRVGQVFDKSFGYAIKIGGKKIRTSIAYLYNNPVEKKLCREAEEYRWNYLAYYKNNNPFSKPIVKKTARKALRNAIAEVDQARSRDIPLTYTMLSRLMDGLNNEELNQLTDYIVSSYNSIDYEASIEYYSSYEDMMTAIHSNTGSEYEINEITTKGDDRIYVELSRALRDSNIAVKSKRVISAPLTEKQRLAQDLYGYTQATIEQLDKYLWISDRRITKRRRKSRGA